MTDQIIPFGKLKGKPLAMLAQDKEYANWLVTRPDFKKKYPDIHMFIINNFREVIDTPEHNELQVKFLDKNFSLKFAYLLEPRLFDGTKEPKLSRTVFESGYDVSYSVSAAERNLFLKIVVEIKPTIGDDFPSVLRQMKASMPIMCDDHGIKTFYCLLLRDYVGEGASKEQFIQFFQTQGYIVVFLNDIENIVLKLEGVIDE